MRHSLSLVPPLFTALWLAVASAGAQPPRADLAPAFEALAEASAGTAVVTYHQATGLAQLVRLDPQAIELEGATAKSRSLEFLARYGALFGVTDPARQLQEIAGWDDRVGHSHLVFRQLHEGLAVFGGELRAHLDQEGRLFAMNGLFVPEVAVDPVPAVPLDRARAIAVALVAKGGALTAGGLVVADAELMVYRDGLARGLPGPDHLAWRLEVTNGRGVREFVFLDAHDGQVVERIPGIHHLHRMIDERTDGNTVWTEGDPLPYSGSSAEADPEINRLITTAAEVFDLFMHLSGGMFPSWDAADGTMRSVYDSEDFECETSPNASWNGSRTAYCPGMTDDDTVAHEWTHAYTDSTHNLTYLFQSGALNESYSDIFGETLDLINGVGTDSPDLPRLAGECSVYAVSTLPNFLVLSPPSLQGSIPVSDAEFNPSPPWSLTGQLELVDDGTEPVIDACEPLVGFTAGNIAVIDRGDCDFIAKVRRAEDAGAVAAVVINNQGDDWVRMARPDGDGTVIAIPSVFMRQSDGDRVKAELPNGVQARVFVPEAVDPSVRWAMAEDSLFEGLRDLWNPNCLGDPNRVSDPLYRCSFDDDGGVHSNSGVPNHAFALTVDGGTYNGRTIQGIGLTRAAHIWWRAMAEYQVHLSDFAMHADALELACQDLIGATLTDLGTGSPSEQTITAAHCAQVSQAAAAVELRLMPACVPIIRVLDPGAPALTGTRIGFRDDFEGGPRPGWTFGNQGVYAEYQPRDWQWTTDVPAGGSGGAMHAINSPLIGDCQAGSDDQSGAMSLTTPPIAIPAGSLPMLAFDHYVATEKRFDGGNLKLSVNGGPFELVPDEAFLYNEYNVSALESAAMGNTNPMAGEPAFSGTDWGTARSIWGQSQVDLSGLVEAGDVIRVRFDFGVDGCVGALGWYLDNVQLRTVAEASLRRGGRRVGRSP